MNRIFNRFTLIVTCVGALLYTYLAMRLCGSSWLAWIVLSVPFIAVWALPVIFWSLEKEPSEWMSRAVQIAGFTGMGVLTYLLLFCALRDLIFLPLTLLFANKRIGIIFGTDGNVGILILSLITLIAGSIRALRGPCIKEVAVHVPNLPGGLQGFRIVQLSDLHIGATIRNSYVENTVQISNGLSADLIALTGDFVDGEVELLRPLVAPLARLSAKLGVFFVPGNHEYYWEGERWIEEMRRLGAVPLLNQNVWLEHCNVKFLVAGVVDYAASQHGKPKCEPSVQDAIRGGESAAYKILLAHQPRIAAEAERAGFDLQLSGHTHGGQFFPWTWVARRVHQYFLGLYRINKMWIYISPGTGTWGPPFRVGTQPEVTLIRLWAAPPGETPR